MEATRHDQQKGSDSQEALDGLNILLKRLAESYPDAEIVTNESTVWPGETLVKLYFDRRAKGLAYRVQHYQLEDEDWQQYIAFVLRMIHELYLDKIVD